MDPGRARRATPPEFTPGETVERWRAPLVGARRIAADGHLRCFYAILSGRHKSSAAPGCRAATAGDPRLQADTPIACAVRALAAPRSHQSAEGPP